MARSLTASVAALAWLLGVSACPSAPPNLTFSFPATNNGSGSGGGTTGSGGAASAGVGGGDGDGGLPCAVADVLAAHCDSCHTSAANIPPILEQHADFLVAATSDASKNLAEVSLERMQDSASPMPPANVPPASDVAVFAQWLSDGLPSGSCGGAGGAGGSAGSIYDTPLMCSSDTTWTNGSNGDTQMYPGQACNDCHATEKPGEIYTMAGTVYASAHEPDDCYGVATDAATVELIDANGQLVTAATGSTGNFESKAAIAFPATVRVVTASGASLPMIAPIAAPGEADCNLCHTQDGANGAPGRIILPP